MTGRHVLAAKIDGDMIRATVGLLHAAFMNEVVPEHTVTLPSRTAGLCAARVRQQCGNLSAKIEVNVIN